MRAKQWTPLQLGYDLCSQTSTVRAIRCGVAVTAVEPVASFNLHI